MIKAQDDVDILAFDKTGKKVLLCECKFRNKPMPMEEYDDLVMAAEMFKNAEEKYLMFFSKSGFTESVKERAAREKLTLDNDTFENTGKSRFFERRTSRVLY